MCQTPVLRDKIDYTLCFRTPEKQKSFPYLLNMTSTHFTNEYCDHLVCQTYTAIFNSDRVYGRALGCPIRPFGDTSSPFYHI